MNNVSTTPKVANFFFTANNAVATITNNGMHRHIAVEDLHNLKTELQAMGNGSYPIRLSVLGKASETIWGNLVVNNKSSHIELGSQKIDLKGYAIKAVTKTPVKVVDKVVKPIVAKAKVSKTTKPKVVNTRKSASKPSSYKLDGCSKIFDGRIELAEYYRKNPTTVLKSGKKLPSLMGKVGTKWVQLGFFTV